LEANTGGKAGTLRELATHIFQVEQFFATLLLQDGAGSSRPPAARTEKVELEELQHMHQDALGKLEQYIGSATEEALQQMRTLGPVTVSSRKILTQTVLHSVHHWAQVAMEVRQAGFPTERPQDIIASPVMK
jgi:uncharacterized damage-inducible protein DinB